MSSKEQRSEEVPQDRCVLCGTQMETEIGLDTGVCPPCSSPEEPDVSPERMEAARKIIADHLRENASSRVPMSPEYGDYLIETGLEEGSEDDE